MSIDKKIITQEEFNAMKSVYDKQIKPQLGAAYTEFVYIDISDLKAYIERVEKQAQSNETVVKGIKFYMVSQDNEKAQMTLVLQAAFDNEKVEADLMNRFDLCPPICDPE